MTWEQGRQLASITYNNKTTTYQYNSDGIRTKKTNSDGSYVVYYLAGGKAIGETHFDANNAVQYYLRYTFDETGSVVGFSYWGAGENAWNDYYFVKNLQGDVLQVYWDHPDKDPYTDPTCDTCVASYTYDSWGNILTSSGAFSNINPFRYRSYYYDSETWFYYLQSRYYDPSIGRFINADDIHQLGANGDFTSLNLFAYCGNNPVTRNDAGGNAWETIFDIISLAGSVAEVVANPMDPWAWGGLIGDVVDVVVPFVGGLGEAVDVAKTVYHVVDKGDDIIDAAKSMRRFADAADDIKDSTGAYVVLFEQGQHYVGKGGFKRAITSASEHLADGNKVSAIIWAPTPSQKSAFVTEYLLQSTFGVGKKVSNTFNKIWSPGKKILGSLQ